tara:strand:- start:154 stop:954 length:801 start_codon:yes stop_codon:yes gene_type:complete
MKKILGILFLIFLLSSTSFAGVKKGKGQVEMSNRVVERFITYLRGKKGMKPSAFILSSNGSYSHYWYCGSSGGCRDGNYEPTIRECEEKTGVDCGLFARKRTIVWKNDINPGKGKVSKINSKWSDSEIRAKLTELGFLGGSTSSTPTTTTPKITKKITKKVVKKYSESGERSIALSWDGYEDLIAGTVEFDEADYKGTLNLPLPNNDGNCDGSYSLQKGGKGTWQIACTNDMGAAGTLKWTKNGGVTGIGRDHNDKKVKFTVSKKS